MSLGSDSRHPSHLQTKLSQIWAPTEWFVCNRAEWLISVYVLPLHLLEYIVQTACSSQHFLTCITPSWIFLPFLCRNKVSNVYLASLCIWSSPFPLYSSLHLWVSLLSLSDTYLSKKRKRSCNGCSCFRLFFLPGTLLFLLRNLRRRIQEKVWTRKELEYVTTSSNLRNKSRTFAQKAIGQYFCYLAMLSFHFSSHWVPKPQTSWPCCHTTDSVRTRII